MRIHGGEHLMTEYVDYKRELIEECKHPISCKFCDGYVHTNADFRVCIQCGQEQITSEYWRLGLK
jgi:hypothetical protein